MEFINKGITNHQKIKAIVFDFDGTISTLRQGWEHVMGPLMIEMIDPNGVKKSEVEKSVEQYLDESTGIQTIFQMQWLIEKIKEYGLNLQEHDEWWYKEEYNNRLMKKVNKQLSDLTSGKLCTTDFLIKGSEELLKRLVSNNIDLYVASGTDNTDVINEIKALGLYSYFKGIAGAPYRKTECSKGAVIKELIEKKGLSGESLMLAGDGKVEIILGKDAHALTLGVATDEVKRCGINQIKRERLIKAGADIITGDFSNMDEFDELLDLK